jgi:hypothetical protein
MCTSKKHLSLIFPSYFRDSYVISNRMFVVDVLKELCMPLNCKRQYSVIIVILIIKTLKQLYVGKNQLTLLQSLA